MSDGCVYLLKELTMVRCADDAEIEKGIFKLFTKHSQSVADLGFVDHFKHSASLKEQLFKSLTAICSAEGLGKKKFRGFVELYLDPAFRNMNHSSQNCSVAAQDFINGLSKVFGANIARAIVENHDSKYLAEYDQIKQTLSGMQGMQPDFIYPGNHEQMGQRPFGLADVPPHQMTAFPGGPSPGNFPAGWRPPSFQQQQAAQ